VQTYPEVLFRAVVAIEVLAIALVGMALLFNAPLEGIADPRTLLTLPRRPGISSLAGNAALLSAGGRGGAGSRIGRDSADCDSLFQHQHRS